MPDTPDDFPAAINTSGMLTLGVKTYAHIESIGDVDWFRFHAEAGQHYSFTPGLESGSAWISQFKLYDASGKLLDMASRPFEPFVSGDYFLSVQGGGIGAYNLLMQKVVDDYSANDSSPGQLTLGAQVSGLFQYEADSDRYKVDMVAGQIYSFELRSDDGPVSNYLQMSFSDAGGKAVSADVRLQNGVARAYLTVAQSGTYALNVSPGYLGADRVSAYTLKEVAAVGDDYGDTMATAAAMSIGTTINGSIQAPTDSDMVKVELQAGTTYSFALLSLGAVPKDPELRLNLSDSSGKNIADVGYGREKNYSYTPTSSGTYFLAASTEYQTLANYSLSASLTADDHGATAATATALAIGSTTKGVLEAGGGDRDWFAVALDAGVTYWFKLTGDRGDNTNPYYEFSTTAQINVLDQRGAVLGTLGGQGVSGAWQLPFVPSVKGTYFLEVTSPDRYPGTYQLQAQVGVPDDVGNDAAHAAVLTSNQAMAGRLEVSIDKDVFKLSAVAGTTYGLNLAATAVAANWSDRDLSVTVTDASQKTVALTNTSTYDAKPAYFFDAKASGDYYFTVAIDRNSGSYGGPGTYALTVNSYGQDDFANGVASTGQLAVNGRQQGNISYPGDKDWVKVHLETGRTYVFDLQGAHSGGGTLGTGNSTSQLTLANATGYEYATERSAYTDPRLTYVATTTGDFYLVAQGDGKQTGSYTLLATQTSGDLRAPVMTASSVQNGASGVGLNGKFTLTFDELVAPGTISGVRIHDASGAEVSPVYYGGNYAVSASGNQLTIDTRAFLLPGRTYTLTLPADSVLDLAGNQAVMPASISFSTVAAAAVGSAGKDYLVGTGTGLHIDGGAGIDTVSYAGSYMTVARGATQTTVTAPGAAKGDILTGIERLQFADGSLALDIDGNAGQAYRLYQAAFNRWPDGSGLGFWISALDQGVSLHTVAQGFVESAEFKNLYGAAPNDADFVKLLYNNVLHRAPDQAGSDYWTAGLHNGAARADILINFSESPENQAGVIGSIGNGISYTLFG